MCITIAEVRKTSVTGEFDAVADQVIKNVLDLVCPKYKSLRQTNTGSWRLLVAFHAAHYIHVGLKAEGEGGGGQVASESFVQVGSRSYATTPIQQDGSNWWAESPYGKQWRLYWSQLPPALRAVG